MACVPKPEPPPALVGLLLPLALASCTSDPRVGPGGAADPSGLPRDGWEVLAAGRLEAAAEFFERSVASEPGSGEAWLGLALAREGLAEARVSEPRLRASAEGAFLEAIRLLPEDPRPRLGAARVALATGDLEAASERSIEARVLAEARRARPEGFEANVLLARTTLRRLGPPARPLMPGEQAGSLLRRAAAAIARSRALEPSRPEPFGLEAELASLEGEEIARFESLRRGVETCPEDAGLHDRLFDACASGVPRGAPALEEFYEALTAAHPKSATSRWYLALARRAEADRRRGANAWTEAAAAYAAAAEALEKAVSLDPARREAGELALAGLAAARAWCRLGAGDLPSAARLFLEALERRPSLLEIPDAFGRTPREGIDRVSMQWTEGGELEGARDLLERAIAFAPDSAEWQGRLARLCRETGTAAETAREGERARALYEASEDAYARALALAPDDPLLLVEYAGILLHHLGRDFDRAEELLRRAVESGERALADASLSQGKRDDLSGVIGDAYENLGVLYYDHRRDPEGARAFFRQSLDHVLRPRPRVRWYLSKIEGGSAGPESLPATPPR